MSRQGHAGHHILGHARMLVPHPAADTQRSRHHRGAHPGEATAEAPTVHAMEDTTAAARPRQRRVPCH